MLDKKYNFLECEKKWQDYWDKIELYKFNENAKKENIYSIDTPPPTVNGNIHIGHIFSYSQTEIMARYFRMKGYDIFYPFGFDDNGLPTERLVEKQCGKRAHEFSREEFTNLCLETTQEFEKKFKELFKSLAFSVDWNNEYSTVSLKSQKISQKSFIDLYKKEKAYYTECPTLWCTECRTSIAQAELETKIMESTFNYINFKLKDSDEFITIATTRPELLAGCVCIFVNQDDEKMKKYVGKEVIVPIFDFSVSILVDEKVDIEKGTGAVMCCTFGDVTDVEWWKKHKLPLKRVITKEGKIEKEIPYYGGLKVLEARKKIVEDLKEKNLIVKIETIEHPVAVHERCGKEVEFNIIKQWFIKILEDREKFKKAGDMINWYPENMKEKYTRWVENVQWDWCISRQRYFGVPFPIWYCKDCGEIIVADENDLPVNPINTNPNKKCSCGSTQFIPEYDVMDTWNTSSVTPLINNRWGENNELLDKLMPMSLRANAHEIIRTWDFYTIVKNMYHMNEIPWKDVMISGFALAGKNEKISKSKGNSVHDPEKLIKQYSADVVRYWAASGRLGADIVYSEETLKNGGKLINKIWNASKFVLMHLEDFKDNSKVLKNQFVDLLPMDRWILVKLKTTIHQVTNQLEKYEIGLALNTIEKFFWEFCDDYIEIVKNRLYKPEIYGEDARYSGQVASYLCLFNILKMFAMYFPFITEEIYQAYFREKEQKQSIHVCRIDAFEFEINNEEISKGDKVINIISEVRKYKSENNLSLKTELQEIIVETKKEQIKYLKTVEYDIKAVCNCKEIIYNESIENEIEVEIIQ